MLLGRNQSGNVNVFRNVCCNRGMILVDIAKQVCGLITCPYYALAYDLDGALR